MTATLRPDPARAGRVMVTAGDLTLGYLRFEPGGVSYIRACEPGSERERWCSVNGGELVSPGKRLNLWRLSDPMAVGNSLRLDMALTNRSGRRRKESK